MTVAVASATLRALATDLGSDLISAAIVPWGDVRTTYRLTLRDGREVAARHVRGADAEEQAAAWIARSERFASSGIRVPPPIAISDRGGDGVWLVMPWLSDGVGSLQVADPASAVRLATGMGRLSRQIAAIDPIGLELDRTWADAETLLAAAGAWTRTIVDALDATVREAIEATIDGIGEARTGDPLWQPVLAHGDFAPINVLVGDGGALILLDLDDVAVAPRLFDLAWWGWVVRYHHPTAWAVGWPALLDGAGLVREAALDSAAVLMARVRCLQRAAEARDDRGRALWIARLRSSLDW